MAHNDTARHGTRPSRPRWSRTRKKAAALGGAAAGVTVVLTGVAAPSHAAAPQAFVDPVSNTLVYQGNDLTNRVLVSRDLPRTLLLEEPVNGITPGPGCARVTSTTVRCTAISGTSAFSMARLDLRGGHDEVKVQVPTVVHVSGGAGLDTYFAASAPTGTSVVFDGGADVDRVDYRFSDAGVAVDLDNAFDDGRIGRDRDNILPSVEDLSGSDHGDSLRGSSGRNRIAGGLGADALRGGGGADEINAAESNPTASESDLTDLSCGSGVDTITLDDVDPRPAECETVRRVR